MIVDEHVRSTYPPAPWRLGGWGVATVGLVDARAAEPFVPSGARLIAVAPGKTLGGLFFLSYERGPLVYRELNVVAGLIRVGARFAFLIPRLYVDSAASLAGGRDLWALPKELAAFEIGRQGATTSIDVRQTGRSVCRLQCTSRSRGLRLPLPMPLPATGVRDDAFLFFTGHLRATMSLARASIELPADGAFQALGLERPLVAVRCDDLTLTVPAAKPVARAPQRRTALSPATLTSIVRARLQARERTRT